MSHQQHTPAALLVEKEPLVCAA